MPVERWLNKDAPDYNSNWDLFLAQIDKKIKELILSLKKGMEPPVEKDDSW